jgi:iron complex outermembrane receptor protein
MARGVAPCKGWNMGSTAIALVLNAMSMGVGAPIYPAQASISPQERAGLVRSYHIPAGSMGAALNAFADKSNLHVLYDSAVTERLSTGGLSGSYSVGEGLDRLLSGTGLTYRLSENGRAVSMVPSREWLELGWRSLRGAEPD